MSKHTPGPWQHVPSDPIHSDSRFVVWGPRGPGHGIVCHCSPYVIPGNPDEAEANARLIAAAPELLAACEHLLPILASMIPDTTLGGWNWPMLHQQLADVVNKATQETER